VGRSSERRRCRHQPGRAQRELPLQPGQPPRNHRVASCHHEAGGGGDRDVALAPEALDERQHRDHLPARDGPCDGRGRRGDRRRRGRPPVIGAVQLRRRHELGASVFRIQDAEHPQDRHAQRDRHEPRPGRCVRDAPEPCPRRFGRHGRFRPPVRVVDPRRGLRRGNRIPDRPSRSQWMHQHLLSPACAQSGFHGRLAASLWSHDRAARNRLDARGRSLLPADRNRAHSEEPPSRAEAAARGRFQVPVPGVERRSGRPGATPESPDRLVLGGESVSRGEMSIKTATLKVPGADLYYEVRGAGAVLVMMPGGPADAWVFRDIAGILASNYTGVTYDPRGLSHSKLESPLDKELIVQVFADDVHRLLAAVAGKEKGFAFASSGGATISLELAARHPEQLDTLVVHEPPSPSLQPDPDRVREGMKEVVETYRKGDGAAAMQKFAALIRLRGQGAPPAPEGEPTPEMREAMAQMQRNMDLFFTDYMEAIADYEPDLDALEIASCRIVAAVGDESRGELAHDGGLGLAKRLETKAVVFP